MDSLIKFLIMRSLIVSVFAIIFLAIAHFSNKRYKSKSIYYALFMTSLLYIIPNLDLENIINGFISKNQVSFKISSNNIVSRTTNAINYLAKNDISSPLSNKNMLWRNVSIVTLIGCIWLVVMILISLCYLIKYHTFIKLNNRWNEDVTDCKINKMFRDTLRELNIKRNIMLRQSELVSSPMLTGVFKPTIVLPKIIDEKNEDFAFYLKHELIHYKHKDNIIKILTLIIQTVYWFNPVIYLLVKKITLFCEISCDEQVLLNKDYIYRKQYGEAIIGIINMKKLNSIFVNNLYSGKKGMKRRMYSIMDDTKKKRGTVIIISSLALLFISVTILTQQVNATTNSYDIIAVVSGISTPIEYSSISDYCNLVGDIEIKYNKLYAEVDTSSITDDAGLSELQEQESAEYNSATAVIYEPFGLIYNEDENTFSFEDQKVRYFIDDMATKDENSIGSRVVFFKDGSIDVSTIRDSNGNITGLEIRDATSANGLEYN